MAETNTKAVKEVEIGEAAMTIGATMEATVVAAAVVTGMTPSKAVGVEIMEEAEAKEAGAPIMEVTAVEATWATMVATAAMAAVAIGMTTPNKAAGVAKAEVVKVAGDPVTVAKAIKVVTIKDMVAVP